jgi:hypothetical protein
MWEKLKRYYENRYDVTLTIDKIVIQTAGIENLVIEPHGRRGFGFQIRNRPVHERQTFPFPP